MTEPQHGTWNTYNYHLCRCDLCAAAASTYMKAWRLDRKLGLTKPGPKRRSQAKPGVSRVEQLARELKTGR